MQMKHLLALAVVAAFALSAGGAYARGGHSGGKSSGSKSSSGSSKSSGGSKSKVGSHSSKGSGASATGTDSNSSSHRVRGHVKKDGTFVEGHRATNRDQSKRNNYSTKGNFNPYTGKEGTKDPDKK